MSKILSETKSPGLNLTLLFCIYLSLLPLTVAAQKIDFSAKTIKEPVNVEFWKRHLQKGIELDSSLFRISPQVIFHRPMDFERAAFDSSVSFLFTDFNSTADFRETKFRGRADFVWTEFKGMADLGETKFKGRAGFWRTTFDSIVNFGDAEFDSTADFRKTKCKGEAGFVGTKFHGTADFRWAPFDSSVSFVNAGFHSTAFFGVTEFKGTADFSSATFDSSVSFRYAGFCSTAYFVRTKFKGKADFKWARFGGDVLFLGAILPGNLDFRYVKDISKEIDFTFSLPPNSKEKCHIALAGADISKIKLNMTLFTLWFPKDTTFGKSSAGKDSIIREDTTLEKSSAGKDSIIRIDSTSYDGQLSVYESVLKKLKDDGLMESYKILDIEYRRFKYKHGGFFGGYIPNTFWHWLWNYGYSKWRVFAWTFGLWVVFSLLNLIFFYPKLSESVYAIAFLEKLETSVLTGVKKRLFYFFQVVTYTAIVFFGLKMDVAKFKKGVVREHPGLFVYLMFVYVVGLVCLGFIVNIIFTR
jgi:uncharacterized protein YjbI with pentapeptide repeats